MKKYIFLLVFWLVASESTAQNFTLQVDTVREYRLHLPINYTPSETYPLLFAFHGGFGLDWQFENETSFSDLADTAGVIVVYPQAIGTTRSWNTGVCCGWSYNNGISDLDFVDSLVNHLTATYSVDTNRIYATGFSSGAMMTYAVGCKFSGIFAAIAPVSSSMLIDECMPDCTPVPVIHLHAEPDSSALFHGGYSGNPLLQFYYPPVDSVMKSWSVKNNCEPDADTIDLANGTRIFRWNDCDNNSYLEIWLADDGGHKWAGTPGKGVLSGDSATQDFYATELVWNFLQQFTKGCSSFTGIYIDKNPHKETRIYPNPACEELNLDIEENRDFWDIQVLNSSGEVVLQSDNQKVIDLKSLPSGQYFIKIIMEGKVETHPFIKVE